MKSIILLLLLISGINVFGQSKSFQVGEEVEYFNDLNWVDSKVLQIGTDGRYLLMLDHNPNKNQWFSADQINSIAPSSLVVEAKVTETQNVRIMLFHVGDTVKYQENGVWIETEVLKIGSDFTYEIFTDQTHSAITLKAEEELVLIKCVVETAINNSQTVNSYSFKIDEKIEYYDSLKWQLGKIMEISQDQGAFLIALSEGGNMWFEQSSIRKPVPTELRQIKKDIYEAGDKIYFYNGSEWIESEIIQTGEENQYQVYFNIERTITKWIDVKELK